MPALDKLFVGYFMMQFIEGLITHVPLLFTLIGFVMMRIISNKKHIPFLIFQYLDM